MNEHDDMNQVYLETRLRSAIHAEADEADPGALHERVRSIPDTVEPQPQRWWHGLSSGASRGAGLDGARVRVKGGTRMFSAVRVAAVVAVLAIGTTFAISSVSGPADPIAPAAETPVDPEWVGVTGSASVVIRGGSLVGTQTMSDPRVGGDVVITYDYESGRKTSGDWTAWGAVSVTNDDGAWIGEYVGFVEPDGMRNVMLWMEGTEAYEGLTYLGHWHGPLNDASLTGLVYPGSIPPSVVLGMDGPLRPVRPLPAGE